MPFDDRLQAIIAHAYANAPAFKKMMDAAGLSPADIQSYRDLPKLPVTTKEQLLAMQRENPPFGGWLAVPPATVEHIFISPGPLFEPEGGDFPEEWRSAVFAELGIGAGDIVFNTFMYHLTPAGLRLDAAVRATGATVVPTGPGNTEYQVEIMLKLGATGYVGTPGFLKIMFEKAAEMGIPAEKIPVKKALFTAEPYPPSLRTYFEDGFGMRTAQTYATAELGIIAYDTGGEPGMKLSDTMIVEIADPATGQPVPPGEPGQVVVTNFNRTYPMIRLGTGDLSALTGEPDADGYYWRIKGWLGRVGDAVKVRGMFLHPVQLKSAAAKFPQIGAVQAIITRPETRDHIRVRAELVAETADRAALAAKIRAAVSAACRLRVDAVELVSPGEIDPAARTVLDERTWE